MDAAQARQTHVQNNQLQRWDAWYRSRDSWREGLTSEEKRAIVNADWARHSEATHGAATAALDGAQRIMARNNQLLANTIGRWVGQDFVRPISPLDWPKKKASVTDVDGETRTSKGSQEQKEHFPSASALSS